MLISILFYKILIIDQKRLGIIDNYAKAMTYNWIWTHLIFKV